MRFPLAAAALAVIGGFASFALSSSVAIAEPHCLRLHNVSYGDALIMRAKPSASAKTTGVLVPGRTGILVLEAPCTPKWKPWGQRWCWISNYQNGGVTYGYVKARFIRDAECP